MGNSASQTNSDDDDSVTFDCDAESNKEGHLPATSIDLSLLFQHDSLREITTKLKPATPNNVLQQNCKELMQWLESRLDVNEKVVTASQFCELLGGRGASREDCMQAYSAFDSEGTGEAEIEAVMEALRSSGGAILQGELSCVIRVLQSCPLMPGFIDVYSDKHSIGQHGQRLLSYIVRNRANTFMLPVPVLSSYHNMHSLRLVALKHIFEKICDWMARRTDEQTDAITDCQPITKCTSGIEVSSNQHYASNLTNGESGSYWQSDGSARSHWIRLRIRNNVLLKQLVITVATSDQSYMPQLVSVSVGKTPDKLKEIKEVRVPSNVTGDVTLLENTKSVFPFVQINIKRCHSDGCDTRVRGIKTLGQRVHYSPGLSVTDATAIWYLQVIASTATAYIPVAPQLRQTILEHSKQALTHIAPLSLTHSSAERPAFLTPIVLGEISRFLESLALDPSGTSVIDGLHVMLWFSLARGHLASIISTLQCILKHPEMKMACIPLITSLDSIYTSTLQRHAVVLHPALAGTSGGKRDIFSSPSNLLSSSPGAGYVTAAGVTKVNVHFKSDDYLELTRLNIKVHRGAIGARSGLVFVYTAEGNDNVCSSKYSWDCCDSWTEKDFAEFKANQGTKVTRKGPVAFFHLDDDWDEVEVKLADVSSGKNIMIKFLQPRGPASMIGIMSIHFFGYKRKHVTFIGDICTTDTEAITDTVERNGPLGEADSAYGSHHVQTSSSEVVLEETGTRHSSLAHVETEDDNTLVSCETLVARMLQFVSGLAVRQAESLSSSLARHMTLDLSDFTIDAFWQLYSLLLEAGDSTVWACCRVLCLQLFLALLPNISEASVQKSCKISTLFQHLCDVVDGRGSHCHDEVCVSSYYQDSMKAIAQEIISSGATIFYPDDEARRKQLFSMIDTISADNVSESASMVFQSLCQFFGNVNPQAILFLPVNLPDDFSIEPTLGVLSKLLTVAKTEYMTLLTENSTCALPVPLLSLLCSLQNSVLAWCMLQQSSEKRKIEMCQNLLVRWTAAVTEHAVTMFDMLLAVAVDDTQEEKARQLERTLLGQCTRQLVLGLFLFTRPADELPLRLVSSLLALVEALQRLNARLPALFWQYDSPQWTRASAAAAVEMRAWNVESAHNYDNDAHVTQRFTCAGAAAFAIEFDAACETEPKYDYVEFSDAHGVKKRFDGRVGGERWPASCTFAGDQLHFLFHSDGSNTEWGYKFTVTARGYPDMPICWLYDLQLQCAKLLGSYTGLVIQMMVADSTPDDVAGHELWPTLFRGGRVVRKLTRSFSGMHESCTDESAAYSLLRDLLEEKKESRGQALLEQCRKSRRTRAGGAQVDAAIAAVFAALIWHTQQLREEVEQVAESEAPVSANDGVLHAYAAAESVRSYLLEQRQRQRQQADDSAGDPAGVDPVQACHEKAEMLLGFAGLLRRDAASCGRLLRSGGKPQRVPPPSDRATSPADETPALDARQASFCLVLSFVRDCALASDKVERLLAERRRRAAAVADALDVTFKFLSLGEDILHLPNVLFLQELLTHLDKTVSRMPWHYADKINGCGLQLEARVRGGYYALVGQLVNAVKAFDRRSARTKLVPIYDFMLACTLHLLDIPWQPYDFAFLQSIEFPRLLMDIASSGITIHGIVTDEDGDEKELAEYEQYMQWLPECRENVNRWYKKMLKQAQKKQDVQMFIARFSDLLNVEIECDGCGATLTGRRYRCLQCAELDLCCTCFIVAVKPSDDAGSDGEATAHADDHDFVNLMFKCNCCEAFIVGTRMHCRECDDYDLCVGCHRTARAYPGGHASAHAVDRHPLVKLRNSPLSESVMQTYAHQHVWLLLSSFALSLTALLSREDPGLDPAYLRSATALQADCFTLATTALQQVVTLDGDAVAGRHQVAFSPLSQEKIVGLLGAMILSCGEHRRLLDAVRSNELLVLLFRIAQRQTLHDCNTAHMALTILGRLLQLLDVDTCSKAVRAAQSLAANDASSPQDERVDVVHAPQLNEVGMDDFETQPGASVVQFLFQFGTQCLDRGLQDWTSSVVMILQSMSSTEVWRDGVLRHVSECIYQMKYAITSEEILCLLVAAGFPDLLSTGVKVLYNEAGSEGEVGFIVKHFVDAGKCLLVNQQTRKRSTVKNQYINRVHEPVSIINQQHLRGLLDVITTLIAKADGREKMSSAALWALALCFKSLYHMCKNSGEERTPLLALCNEQLIRVMMRQASLGTGFNKQCMVQELEVLSLMLYTADESKLIDSDAVIPEPKTKVRKKSHEAAAAASGSSGQAAPSTNVRRDASVCFGVLHEHIVQSTLTHSDLKNNTTHENSGGQHAADALLLEMYKNLFDTKLRSTRASANSLASLDEQPLASGSDSDSDGGGVDTGVIRFALRMPSPGPVETEATRETQEGDSCLMRVEDSELEDKLVQKHRVRSSQMLRQELEACRTGTSRRYLYRLNLTLSVFHARHLLAEVLAAWPLDSASLVITGELLGCTNDSQIACVLDLLHRWDNSKTSSGLLRKSVGEMDENFVRDFQQLVTHVVKHCGTSCANAIAQAACYFMEESSFDSCTKESDHSYTEARATSGKVHIPNASFLLVKFDRRCHTRAKWDELSLALDGNFEQELHVYSGTSSDDQWQNFHLPGDTLYYKFCKRLDVRNSEQSVKPEFWGWRFTVTGGRMGRFDTGYMIMNSLLCHEPTLNTLPMERIWSYLVHVACKQTGQQRLKTIELLLRVLNSMGSPGDSSQKAVHDDRKCTSDTADDVFTKEQFASNTAEKLHAGTQHTSGEADNHSGALQSGRVDLTLLRPLWLLYGSLQEKQLDTGSAVIPQLNRALTELFYVAEERAGAWSVVDAYLLATHDYAALRDVVAEVAVDIAAIGAAIECTNAATNLCRHCLAA